MHMNLFLRLYNAIHLNMGIKRYIRSLTSGVFSVIQTLDQFLLFRISRAIDAYQFGKIVYHYGADYRWNDEKSQNLDKKQNNYGYGLLHYAMVRNQRPKRILCIGSMYGFIPYMLAKGCMENNVGHVDFVDAGYDINSPGDSKKHIFGQGFWKQKNIQSHFHFLLNKKFITLHVMTSQEYAKKYPTRQYDYIYLDGDHRYKGARSDFKTFWPRLREGGFITLHDIHFDTTYGGITFEQWRLWEELVNTYPYKIELYNHYSGLGLIQKQTTRPPRFQGVVPD